MGRSRCGGLADLIVDQEGVRTADGRPHLLPLARTTDGGYAACRAALTARPRRAVSNVDVGSLAAGGRLCVATDERDTALVRITAVTTDGPGRLTSLTVSFDVWRNR